MSRTAPLAPAVLIGALAVCACGHSLSTTLHTLVAASPTAATAAYAGPPVRVESVRLPPALDRIELLRETAPGRYAVEEFDRWAAPPSRLAKQVLVEDLALRLPAVVVGDVAGGPPVTAVSVEVLSFTAGPGTAALSAAWTRGCRPGQGLARAYVQLETPSSGDVSEALGALIGRLADRIAADLSAAPDLACRSAPAGVAPMAAHLPRS